MPVVSIDHLTVILRMACAQAEVPLDRKGFKYLASKLGDQYAPHDEDVDQRYIDEHIFKPLQKAKTEGNKTVNLGLRKVHKLCNFLNLTDYEHFQQEWLRVGKFLRKKAFTVDQKGDKLHYRSIHDVQKGSEFAMYWAGSVHPEQVLNKDPALLLNEPGVQELVEHLNSETGILWIAGAWMTDEVNTALSGWLQGTEQSGRICVVWDMEASEVKKACPRLPEELVLGNDLLPLIIQVLQYYTEEAKNNGKDRKNASGQSINIKDSGAVFLGGTNTVNADNVSHRDMHITIHNKK